MNSKVELLGSQTSPYVRRLRLFLAKHPNQPYEFISMDIFGEDRPTLKKYNPTCKIPMLKDGEHVIFDSGVIYRYLLQKLALQPLSWDEENNVTTINGCNDSLIELLLCERSGFDTKEDKLFFKLQRARVSSTLEALNTSIEKGAFDQWNYPSMCLFALIDWIEFRKLTDISDYPKVLEFKAKHEKEAGIQESDPRLSA